MRIQGCPLKVRDPHFLNASYIPVLVAFIFANASHSIKAKGHQHKCMNILDAQNKLKGETENI